MFYEQSVSPYVVLLFSELQEAVPLRNEYRGGKAPFILSSTSSQPLQIPPELEAGEYLPTAVYSTCGEIGRTDRGFSARDDKGQFKCATSVLLENMADTVVHEDRDEEKVN